MTLLERIEHFIYASLSGSDTRTADEIINLWTPHELLTEISSALEHAGVTFNKEF